MSRGRSPARRIPLVIGVFAAAYLIGAYLIAGAPLFSVAPAGATAGPVVKVPSSIDASGNSDVTDALNQFFTTVPANATVEFPADARYRAEGTVVLKSLKGVTIDGNGATLFASTDGSGVPPTVKSARAHWPRLRQHLNLQFSQFVTIHDLQIHGPNAAGTYQAPLEGQAGVAIQSSQNVVLDDVSVSTTYGDGFSVIGTSDHVTIQHSAATRIGRQGVTVDRGSNVTVEQSSFDQIARTVFDMEPLGASTVAGVHFTDNTVGSYQNFLLSMGGGHPISDVWLSGTKVTGGNGIAINSGNAKAARGPLHILDNQSSVPGKVVLPGTGAAVMELHDLSGLEVRNNDQSVRGGDAISLSNVCNATISGNDFPGAKSDVVTVAACNTAAYKAPPAATGTKRKAPKRAAAPKGTIGGAAAAARSSHPSGALVWAGVVAAFVVAIVLAFLMGRRKQGVESEHLLH